MNLPTNRWKHFVAMALIGDGVMAVVHPQRDAAAWHGGPAPWRQLMRALHDRPVLTRVVGVAQIAGAIWWAVQQESAEASKRLS